MLLQGSCIRGELPSELLVLTWCKLSRCGKGHADASCRLVKYDMLTVVLLPVRLAPQASDIRDLPISNFGLLLLPVYQYIAAVHGFETLALQVGMVAGVRQLQQLCALVFFTSIAAPSQLSSPAVGKLFDCVSCSAVRTGAVGMAQGTPADLLAKLPPVTVGPRNTFGELVEKLVQT